MINREIIRLKVVQITYAYYQNGGKNIDTAEKELFFSLAKAYDLYNYLLTLMVVIRLYNLLVQRTHKILLVHPTFFLVFTKIQQLFIHFQLHDKTIVNELRARRFPHLNTVIPALRRNARADRGWR